MDPARLLRAAAELRFAAEVLEQLAGPAPRGALVAARLVEDVLRAR